MPLPDNWFRENSPADIITKVGEITLAEISKWTPDELKRVGWADNPIIAILYELSNANSSSPGIWQAKKRGIQLDGSMTTFTTLDDGTTRTQILQEGQRGFVVRMYNKGTNSCNFRLTYEDAVTPWLFSNGVSAGSTESLDNSVVSSLAQLGPLVGPVWAHASGSDAQDNEISVILIDE